MSADTTPFVVIAMLVLMLGTTIGGLAERWRRRKSITHRFIQFVGLSWLIGATVILATKGLLEGTSGTVLGAVAGYLFGMRRNE